MNLKVNSQEFGHNHGNVEQKLKCSECLEDKPASQLESDGYKYVCKDCKGGEQ